MKMIQVVPSLRLGGAEIMCENLTTRLVEHGQDVTVACLYDTDSPITRRLQDRGIRLRFFGKKRGVDLSMIGKLQRLFEEERPEVVHTHTHTVQYAVPAARRAGVPALIHTVHNIAVEEQIRPIRMACAYFYRRGWVTPVALSAEIRRTVEREYGLPSERIPVIYNGIDLGRCIPKESYSQEGPFTVVNVARFDPQKNHEGLLRAFAALRERRPDSELLLIGDGALRGGMEELAAALGISGAVRFPGEQSEVYGFLNRADVFALPSHFEGMPMSLIEAMGTGLPIVAAGVGGVPDMLSDGAEAWLTDDSPESAAAALIAAAEDEGERERRGRAARKRSEQFSSQAMAEAYIELYQSRIK